MADLIFKTGEALSKVFERLSWGKVAMMMVLLPFCLLMAVVGYLWYDNKPAFYSALNISRIGLITMPVNISEQTQKQLIDVVNKDPNIVGAEIIAASLSFNSRKAVYFYTDITEFDRAYDYFQANKVSDTPLFLTGVYNDRIIRILLGYDLVCSEIPPEVVKRIPISATFAKQICSLSIPPLKGDVVGYLNLWLKEPIDTNGMLEMKSLMKELSDTIYTREVLLNR